jgi:hypothetical protein
MLWILIAVAVLLLVWKVREGYVDPERRVTRPDMTDAVWRSKVDAESPIDSDDSKYMEVLQKFYDTVYVPSETKPTDTKVEEFLQSSDAKVMGVETEPLRRIIISSFSIERTTTIAAREQKQQKFKESTELLNPKLAVNPLDRPEKPYTPEDPRQGELPEGVYAPVQQEAGPRRSGAWDDKSTSWSDAQFMGVCECAKNVV